VRNHRLLAIRAIDLKLKLKLKLNLNFKNYALNITR